MAAIKKVVKKKVKSEEVVKPGKNVVAIKDKNVGDPILGMGVKFLPSDETLSSCGLSKKVDYFGKVVLVLGGVDIMKVSVVGLEPRIFVCKKVGDKSINSLVDNSWEEKK